MNPADLSHRVGFGVSQLRSGAAGAVFESAGGTIFPTDYDGAIGPALIGAVAVGIGTIVAAFAPGRVSPR